MRLNK